MTFISGGYGFPMHDQNEPQPKGPGMSNREAWKKIRPRGWKDWKTILKSVLAVVVIFAGVIKVSRILHHRAGHTIVSAPASTR